MASLAWAVSPASSGAKKRAPPADPSPAPSTEGFAARSRRARQAYPRGLAARPLTMPAGLVELGLADAFTFRKSIDENEVYAPQGWRWSISDRFEVRNL